MQLFDPRILQLLSFLTRRQAWLAPHEISRDFHPDGDRFTARTIHRWFHFLREAGGFVYYPYPKANVLGLQDILVRIRGLRKPAALDILPFGASFNVEVALVTGDAIVSQGYWVPGPALEAFRDYWRTARDLGFLSDVEILRARNTHFIYSPFEAFLTEDGTAVFRTKANNAYFEALLKHHLRGAFEIEIGEQIAKFPLIVPIVVEHIWAHFSSRQVWQAIREKGEAPIRQYAHGKFARALERPGAALRMLQQQWSALLKDFNAVFLQPRVLFEWTDVKNAMWVSIVLRPASPDKMVEAAIQASQRSMLTQLKPGAEFEERCHILCWAPSDQLLPILQVVREYHQGAEPPFVAVQDKQATVDLFQPSYCKLDWRLFDPHEVAWRFDGEGYLERLKGLGVTADGKGLPPTE
ncbi:MAG: hypothetical protein ACT4OI_09650 [Methanobacteriota archaeon]